jgi:hypothetical protein
MALPPLGSDGQRLVVSTAALNVEIPLVESGAAKGFWVLAQKEREAVSPGNENMDTTNGLTTSSQSLHTLRESFGRLPGMMTGANNLLGGTILRPAVQYASYLYALLPEESANGRGYSERERRKMPDIVDLFREHDIPKKFL